MKNGKDTALSVAIRDFMHAARNEQDQDAILADSLLFLLVLLNEHTSYATKCAPNGSSWIEFLLLRYPPTRTLLHETAPRVILPPSRAVRMIVGEDGHIGLEACGWEPRFEAVASAPIRPYDVCISFAEEQRAFARRLADSLREFNLSVFYDEDEGVSLWGQDLFRKLYQVYANDSHLCIVLFSTAYLERAWTNHELRAAQARTLIDRRDYVLPILFDIKALPEEYRNIAYLAADQVDLAALAAQLNERIWKTFRNDWIAEDELLEIVHGDIVADTIQGLLQEELLLCAKEPSRAIRCAVMASISAFPYDRLVPKMQGFLRYLLFSFEPIASLFDENNEFVFVSSYARLMRFTARDGVLLYPTELEEKIAPLVKGRYDRLAEKADGQGGDEDSDST